MKVLIVDDDSSVAASTAEILRFFGHDNEILADASQILDRLRADRPDVVLQDVRMPGLNLPKLLAELRADPELEDLPIIVCSAGIDGHDWQSLGATATLGKPYDPRALRALIEELAG